MDLQTTPAKKLADDLGIARDALKKLRDAHLIEGTDWLPAPPGQPILFTAAGVQKLRALLELAPPASGNPWITASAGARTSAPPAPKRETLIVIRPAKGSHRIVLCSVAGRQVSLTVKNNANFIAGMEVHQCVQAPQSPAYYHYEGRLPRRKGRY